MRIRKRQVPLPLSSISPVPLSPDPNINRSPVVQLPQHHHPSLPTTTPSFDPHYCGPSDRPNRPIGQRVPTQGRDSFAFHGTTAKTHGQELGKKENHLVLKQGGGGGGEEDEEKRGEGEKSNDTRKKIVVGAELGTGSLPLSGSSDQGVRRWGEGEKASIPLKKRRGSFERRSSSGNDDDTIMADEKEDNNINNNNVVVVSGAKKRGQGGALMEGSRCSRVNGRGWRCCQQTLVGYSLCEHHLGKGRLRSMTSVWSRSLSNAAAKEEKNKNKLNNNLITLSSIDDSTSSLGGNGNVEELGKDQKPLMMTMTTTTTKKRVKLGVVKARSISSLLGQNDNATSSVADDNN